MQAIDTLKKIVGLDDEVFSDIIPHINALIDFGLNPAHAAYLFFASLGDNTYGYKLKTAAGLFPVQDLPKNSVTSIKDYLITSLDVAESDAKALLDQIINIVQINVTERAKEAAEKAHRDMMDDLEQDDLNELGSGVYTIPISNFVSVVEDGFRKWVFDMGNIEQKKDMIANPSNYSYGEGYSKYGQDAGVVVQGKPTRISKGTSSSSYMKYGAQYGEPKEIVYEGDTLFLARYDDFYLMAIINM